MQYQTSIFSKWCQRVSHQLCRGWSWILYSLVCNIKPTHSPYDIKGSLTNTLGGWSRILILQCSLWLTPLFSRTFMYHAIIKRLHIFYTPLIILHWGLPSPHAITKKVTYLSRLQNSYFSVKSFLIKGFHASFHPREVTYLSHLVLYNIF